METTLERSRAALLRAVHRIAGIERETLVAWTTGALILVALLATGIICTYRPNRPQTTVANPTDAWNYFLICNECGHRARMVEHPRQTLAEQGGMLQCPRCGAFTATWYRRGGQVSPPGGWAIEEPDPTTATGGQP